MSNLVSQVQDLIANDKISQALNLLSEHVNERDLSNEIISHQAVLGRVEKESRRGTISREELTLSRARIAAAVLSLLDELDDDRPDSTDSSPDAGHLPSSVFISYSSSDRDVANRVKNFLVNCGIRVQIDTESVAPGENFKSFIRRSVHKTDVTLSIVSNRSLLSDSVTMESVHSFYCESYTKERRFIACFLDDDFLRNSFRLEATKKIDGKIAEIDNLIPQYIEQKIDTNDLNEQKTRLYELRNQLGEILKRLRGSLCLDIRGDQFDAGLERIAIEIAS